MHALAQVNPLSMTLRPFDHQTSESSNSIRVHTELVGVFIHNYPCYTNVPPNHGSWKPFVVYCGKPIKANTSTPTSLRIEMSSLYQSMSQRLQFLGSIALIVHLHSILVLDSFGSTNPRPPYFFFMQPSFQVTLMHVSCFFLDQRWFQIAPLIFLKVLLDPPQIVMKNHMVDSKDITTYDHSPCERELHTTPIIKFLENFLIQISYTPLWDYFLYRDIERCVDLRINTIRTHTFQRNWIASSSYNNCSMQSLH